MSGLTWATGLWVVGLAVAAFLALYWALRGAPIGQATEDEGDDAPRAGYRDRVIAVVVIGLMLVVAGAYIAVTQSVPWSLPCFAIGFGIVLTLISVNQRHRHDSPALRRTLDLSNTALHATLLAGVLIVANVLAFRYGGRALDFTHERAFSLSGLTINQLKSLKRPVTFTLFFGQSDRSRLRYDRMKQLLDLYVATRPELLRLESVDPFAEFERFEEIMKRAPDVAVAVQGGGVLLDYGEGENPTHVVVRSSDLFDLPTAAQFAGQSERFESSFRGEDAITSALIGLREDKKPKIAFTTGHGEPGIDELDPRRRGIGTWKSRLTAFGSDVVELNLVRDEILADLSILIIVGPTSPFKPDEVARVRSYVERGGPLLVLIGNQADTGLGGFLRAYNITLGQGVIVDRRLSLRGQPAWVLAPMDSTIHHPIVDTLVNRAVLLPNAAPLKMLGGAGTNPANPNVVATPILRTSKSSWAETDLAARPIELNAGKDEPGPLTVGVAITDRPKPGATEEPKPRLVVFSCADFGVNRFIMDEPTNQDLLINAISWLRGKPELKGIAPKTHLALTLTADPALRARLILVPTVMALILIMSLGVVTYLARRE